MPLFPALFQKNVGDSRKLITMDGKAVNPLDKERLKGVAQFIRDHEYNWKELHAKLQDEYRIEWARASDLKQNPYLNNLRQTMEKQVNEYLHASKRDKAAKLRSVFQAFEEDVRQAMGY